MATSVATVVTRAQIAYNDITAASSSDGITLGLLNEIHEELTSDFKIYSDVQYVILNTTDREYTLDPTVKAVWNADYLISNADTPIPLYEASIDELDQEYAGWRFSFTSQPTLYYVDNSTNINIIGFDWIPQTATSPANSTGFPIVRIYCSLYEALTAGGNIPITLKSPAVYIKGLISKWAEYRGKPDAGARVQDYEMERAKLETYLITRQKNNPPRMRPFFAGGVAAR